MNWILVFVGGGAGSLTRFVIGIISRGIFKGSFPMGTLIANLLACLLIGIMLLIVQRTSKTDWIEHLVVIGFCGGLSTFSTFSNENLQLFQSGNYIMAITNILISISSGIAIIYSMSIFKG